MGREIRRVPAGWEHPKNERGYIPMLDETHAEALAEWTAGSLQWANGTHLDYAKYGKKYTFEEWEGEAPGDWYRPAFDTEPTHYQIYETVSEGTPVSPVFASLAEMEAWLVFNGFSEEAAARFAKNGWAPSFVMQVSESGARVSGIGIASLDFEFD